MKYDLVSESLNLQTRGTNYVIHETTIQRTMSKDTTMKCFKLDTANTGNDEVIYCGTANEASDSMEALLLSLGYDEMPDDWSIDSYPGFEVATKGTCGWDHLGAWSSDDECVSQIKDSVENDFDDFFVDDHDCVVMAIKKGEQLSRVFKCYRDGTIIEESPDGAIVGQAQ